MTDPLATRKSTPDRERIDAAPAIELSELSKTYRGGVVAVDALTLSVPPGTVFGLLGPNGAGKTTTIKMIAGLIVPSEGRIRLNGFDVARRRSQAVRQIGAVLEGSRNVWWTATGRAFPLTAGVASLNDVMLRHGSVSTTWGMGGLVWLLGTAVGYLLAGILAIRLGERTAKRRGTLARY